MITGFDDGDPGTEDTFKITLWNNGAWFYENEGDLLGGNIHEHAKQQTSQRSKKAPNVGAFLLSTSTPSSSAYPAGCVGLR